MTPKLPKTAVVYQKADIIIVKHEARGFGPAYWVFSPYDGGALTFSTIDRAKDYLKTMTMTRKRVEEKRK